MSANSARKNSCFSKLCESIFSYIRDKSGSSATFATFHFGKSAIYKVIWIHLWIFNPLSFNYVNSLIAGHKLVHSGGVKPYECSFCGKAFALRGNLSDHQRFHPPFHCKICPEQCPDSGQLKQHLLGHKHKGQINPHPLVAQADEIPVKVETAGQFPNIEVPTVQTPAVNAAEWPITQNVAPQTTIFAPSIENDPTYNVNTGELIVALQTIDDLSKIFYKAQWFVKQWSDEQPKQ